jgi:uncharacterized protein
MSLATLRQAALRIAEHAAQHRLDSVEVVLHGGEPLMAGPGLIDSYATTLRTVIPADIRFSLRLQTNATLLDERMLDVLSEHDVQVGVSLDGDRRAHDRHRLRANGSGSHRLVDQGLQALSGPRYRRLFSGLLCTIDLRNDPVATYEALVGYQPPMVDFLLPHGNWTNPPPGRSPGSTETPYADWLIAVFDRWRSAPRQETRVRLFEEMIRSLLGGASRTEGIGLAPTGTVIVQTDGSIEQSDMMTGAYPAAAATGMDVQRNTFTEVTGTSEFTARQSGLAGLAPECQACPVVRVCGGGFLPHRYRAGSGFLNPSVYCPDLYRLIGHCHGALTESMRGTALRDG